MSVRQRADTLLTLLLSILWLPARVVEEGLHAVAALPWAAQVYVRLDPKGGEAETVIEYEAETPDWAIRLGYRLPELVALISGIAVLIWWAVSGVSWAPQTTLDFALLAIFGAQWLAIALPSAADRETEAEHV